MQTPMPAISASAIGVGERVRDVDVGVERRGVLDQQLTPRSARPSLQGAMSVGEAFGRLLPGQRAAAAGLQVDRLRAERRGDVDGLAAASPSPRPCRAPGRGTMANGWFTVVDPSAAAARAPAAPRPPRRAASAPA